jgi:hypothetical protein
MIRKHSEFSYIDSHYVKTYDTKDETGRVKTGAKGFIASRHKNDRKMTEQSN